MKIFARIAGRSGRALPAIVILLGLTAIASISLLQQRTVASHRAQLRLGTVATELGKLQSEPFDASTEAGGDPALVLKQMRDRQRGIRNTLADLERDSAPRALIEVSAPVRENFATLLRVYAMIGSGQDGRADQLSALGDRQSAAARRLLAQASREYARRASSSQQQATVGSAAAIMLLLAAFGFLYRRSVRARFAVEQKEERFRTLVANIPGAVCRRTVDADWSMQFVSERIEEISGYPASHFVSGEGSWARPVAPEQRELVARKLAAAGDTDAGDTDGFAAEYAITHADGSLRWVHEQGQTVHGDDGAILSVDGVISDITDLKRLEEERTRMEGQLRHQASHDELTGLPNRALFEDRASHALASAGRRKSRVAVMFVDLDDFKLVNDSLGHTTGDELLRTVAQRLRSCLRRDDTAARLGGDEFGVLLEGVADADDAARTALRMLKTLGEPYALADREISLRASIGIALSEGLRYDTDALLRNADIAMYGAKRQDKGSFAFFEPSMHAAAVRRLELTDELEQAFAAGELELHYQPIVVLETEKIVGVEALLRWNHPSKGLMIPAEFLPMAERTGLIVPIGRWVLHEACRQAGAWQRERPDDPLHVCVNVSTRQLQDARLVSDVRAALDAGGVRPEQLVLEITENLLIENVEKIRMRLLELKGFGVRLAVDDFGTGYSALSYLQSFPLDILKIDRSFIDGMEGSKQPNIVRAIVQLGGSLGLEVVAEGVEQLHQLDELRSMNLRYGQGYYFARPMDAAAVTALLTTAVPSHAPEHTPAFHGERAVDAGS